ncbi:MAG: hypothetical protein Q7T07_00535 [Burkholderiaceae bacterium]|nr:hypothetical protein [Burkholderiaceae bacterium]
MKSAGLSCSGDQGKGVVNRPLTIDVQVYLVLETSMPTVYQKLAEEHQVKVKPGVVPPTLAVVDEFAVGVVQFGP